MMSSVFEIFSEIDTIFWGYIAFVLIMLLGLFLTIKTRFFQIRALPSIVSTFFHFLLQPSKETKGTHPLKVFFASVGGMIGIGNIVGIVTAVQIGGPGALLWVWIAGIVGMLIKYSEIFLGLKYRVPNSRGGYDGGPMYFLRHAFNNRWVPVVICVLLCIYGVEIYQFSVVTHSLSTNWNINRYIVMAVFLALVLYAGIGGVARVGKICTWVMPGFILCYIFMSMWVIGHHLEFLPGILGSVVKTAFTGHAAVGGFAGSSLVLAVQHGISRAAYSADIGIGYDSIIQSESKTIYPQRQARLAMLGVCIDNVICTLSMLIVLTTGIWQSVDPIHASALIQTALSQYFPYMDLFMPFFLFILGYTTVIAYFCVGMKCARFLLPKHGLKIYFVYAIAAFVLFSFLDQTKALLIMSLSGSMLLMINLLGIFKLRREIVFKTEVVDAAD